MNRKSPKDADPSANPSANPRATPSANPNQGEGNRDAARRFNQAEQNFVQSGQVEDAAKRAAPRGRADADAMQQAEKTGRRHAKGEDPTVPGANAPKDSDIGAPVQPPAKDLD